MSVKPIHVPGRGPSASDAAPKPLGGLRCVVGESLVWSPREHRLFFIDLVGRAIHSYDPMTSVVETWQTPEFATSIGLRRAGGFIVGLERRVCCWRPDGAFDTIAVPEPDRPGNRLNEGVVGPDGAFWVGTMATNLLPDGSPKQQAGAHGAYYRVWPDGRVERLTENEFGITNTLAWSVEGTLLTADTAANTIFAFRFASDGHLYNRTIFNSGFPRGLPDGSCLDADGYLWNCRVAGGSCLARFAPDGGVDRIVELPCSWPTSCAFGGPDLDVLYVTSARFTMSAEHVAENPQEGGLFAVRPGVKGMAPYAFG